jgi:hypothetical protein
MCAKPNSLVQVFDTMKKTDIYIVRTHAASFYPHPFDESCRAQNFQRLTRYARLAKFGVNVCHRGSAWSSQRLWHSHENELIWMLDSELTLVTNAGEKKLRAGYCAAFRGGVSRTVTRFTPAPYRGRNSYFFQDVDLIRIRKIIRCETSTSGA